MLAELKEAMENLALSINFKRIKFMTILVGSSNMQIDGEEVEQTHEYNCLGHKIRIDKDNQTCEIYCRISLGWAAFGKLLDTFQSNLPICLKRKVYEQCVLLVITYGCKTLTLIKRSPNKLRIAQECVETIEGDLICLAMDDDDDDSWIDAWYQTVTTLNRHCLHWTG